MIELGSVSASGGRFAEDTVRDADHGEFAVEPVSTELPSRAAACVDRDLIVPKTRTVV